MARVPCYITQGTEENESGYEVTCTYAECSKCGQETMSFGDSDESVTRCLAMLREECPRGENNFYYDSDEDTTIYDYPPSDVKK